MKHQKLVEQFQQPLLNCRAGLSRMSELTWDILLFKNRNPMYTGTLFILPTASFMFQPLKRDGLSFTPRGGSHLIARRIKTPHR